MKTKVKLLLISLCLIGGFCILADKENTEVKDLASENIEAIASIPIIACYGEGSVDCKGYSVKIKIDGYKFGN